VRRGLPNGAMSGTGGFGWFGGNKRVNRLRDSMLTQQQLDEAKRYARETQE